MTQQDTQPPAETLAENDTREAIIAAITKADASFGYSYRLTKMDDTSEEHTLFMDGFEPAVFEDRLDGYPVIEQRRNAARTDAILAALTRRAGGDAIPEYAPDDISHLEGLASYLDGYARDKGRAGLPASKRLFEEIAKRLREYDVIRNATPAPAVDAGDAISHARECLRTIGETKHVQIKRDALETILAALALPAPVVEGEVTDRDREIGLAVFRDYLNHDLDDAGGNYEGEECAIHAAARGRIAALSEGRSHG